MDAPSIWMPNGYGSQGVATKTLTTANPSGPGAYVTIFTTTRKTRWLGICLSQASVATSDYRYWIDIAIGATPRIIIPGLIYPGGTSASGATRPPITYGFPIEIPAGLALKARAQSEGDATDTITIYLYAGNR